MSDKLYKTESNAVLRFYTAALKNNFLSEQSGKPIFDTCLMAEVITPGQAASTLVVEIERVINDPAREPENREVIKSQYFDRFKAQVEAHKSDSGEYVDNGQPIRTWAQIDSGMAETLAAQGIYTVEALASIPDSSLNAIGMGGRQLREQAKAFITAREFGIPTAQMTAENETLKRENAELKAENDALKAQIAAMSLSAAPAPSKPGKGNAVV